jgi:hypothetical protein
MNCIVLSILENSKNNQAGTSALSGGLQSRTVPKRMGLCRKAGSSKRGLRKSSSLTNGMSRSETTVYLESMALRPEVFSVSTLSSPSMRPSWATPLTRTVLR